MTSTETSNSSPERFSPHNWSLAWQLVAVGLVPAILALVLGVLRVSDQAGAASELGAANRLLEVRRQVADAAAALRDERDRATLFVAGRRLSDPGPLQEAIGRTDVAIARARAGLAGVNDIIDTPTRAAMEQADGRFAQLSATRSSVTGTAPVLAGQVLQRYTLIVNRTDGLDRAVIRQVRQAREPTTVGLADALIAVNGAAEAIALEHTIVGVPLVLGVVRPDDRNAAASVDSAFIASYIQYQDALPEDQAPLNFVTAEASAKRFGTRSAILLGPTNGPIPVTSAEWDQATRDALGVVVQADNQVTAALAEASENAENRSSNSAGVNAVLLLFSLLVAAAIIVLVARALTRSLRVLRTSALDIAERRLPKAVESMRSGNAPDIGVEPVPLHHRNEIGQVARAFDAVHGQALRLAADQAALQSNINSVFVNLSRRSQGLVDRQLQLIEELESNEQDPHQLSNLFQLDHLATRMRRNSENLLILAGTDIVRRNGAPVPLMDVLRAAVSEIEQYQRIVVQAPPRATILCRATSDIVHLLAELLDNATNFSPPGSQVVVRSKQMADGSIIVEIADHGVGMAEQELGDANRRLTTPSTVDVSASRRMGLFVVGRLGARHGIPVHLGGAPTGDRGGVTASVTLPAHFVVSSGDSDDSQPRAAAAATQRSGRNGVLPRTGSSVRPTPRPALAAPAEAPPQLLRTSGNVNGLPVRIPGSSLPRDPATGEAPLPFAAEPAGRERVDPTEGDAADPTPTDAGPVVAARRAVEVDGARGRPRLDEDDAAPESASEEAVATNGVRETPDAGEDGAVPSTRPLPVVPGAPDEPARPVSTAAPSGPGDGEDDLFAAMVPATREPERQPGAQRPGGESRWGPVALEEITPIFAEIASAWFATDRPVPIDWQLGERPAADVEPGIGNGANGTRASAAEPTDRPSEWSADLPAERPADPPAERPADESVPDPPAERPADESVPDPPARSFATAADEGWRAASGAAAERQDELTSAGLPKRRPQARLVPGSAAPAVPAATAPPTRDAENVRGRLADHQQGVRQGRENRRRHEHPGTGPQSVSTEENGTAPTDSAHDEQAQ